MLDIKPAPAGHRATEAPGVKLTVAIKQHLGYKAESLDDAGSPIPRFGPAPFQDNSCTVVSDQEHRFPHLSFFN